MELGARDSTAAGSPWNTHMITLNDYLSPHLSDKIIGNMHELAYAEEILHSVEREAGKYNAVRIIRVNLSIGKYSGIDKDSLSFCFEAIAPGTLLESAVILMDDVQPEWICPVCGRFPYEGEALSICPICGADVEFVPATEIRIEEIELDDDDRKT